MKCLNAIHILLSCNRQFQSKATNYGKQMEPKARKQYEDLLGVKVQPTGLTLMSEHHYIGASADGICNSATIEIKCPFSGKCKTVNDLVASGYDHITKLHDGSFALNRTSPYFCQVQGEMAIKGFELCHLIIWTPMDFEIISVHYDNDFWKEELLPKLLQFFNLFVRPVLETQ